MILAEEQTAGRGRRGGRGRRRLFVDLDVGGAVSSAAPGPRPRRGRRSACAWLTALGAVAAAEVVTAWTGRDATIKWPNDVRIDGRKIAGILVERTLAPGRPELGKCIMCEPCARWGGVIGIGLNVNLNRDAFPPELVRERHVDEIEGCGTPFDRSEVARDLIRRLDHWYQASRSRRQSRS